MKVGDLVRATWSDGLEIVGTFIGHRRGYIILRGSQSEKPNDYVVCCPNAVKFEILESV